MDSSELFNFLVLFRIYTVRNIFASNLTLIEVNPMISRHSWNEDFSGIVTRLKRSELVLFCTFWQCIRSDVAILYSSLSCLENYGEVISQTLITQKITSIQKIRKKNCEKSFCVIEILLIFCLVNLKRASHLCGQQRNSFTLKWSNYYFANYRDGRWSTTGLNFQLLGTKILLANLIQIRNSADQAINLCCHSNQAVFPI